MKNRKGITWLDEGRIPITDLADDNHRKSAWSDHEASKTFHGEAYTDLRDITPPTGRFPANLLVSDDVLNDGRIIKGNGHIPYNPSQKRNVYGEYKGLQQESQYLKDSGSFSRYFDLDKWAQKTFPFLIVPKASKGEKNRGCEGMYWLNEEQIESELYFRLKEENKTLPRNKQHRIAQGNIHPAVKPVKLLSYLITLGSRPRDIVLDLFAGSGSTGVACINMDRRYILIDNKQNYVELSRARTNSFLL